MRQLLRPTLVITLFTLVTQAVGFLTQIAIAAYFGAQMEMDAFLAATTLPQYVIAVLLSALSFVFIPVFVDHMATSQQDQAWEVARGVITLCLVLLSSLTVGGIIFAKPLLQLVAPGLSSPSLHLATKLAIVTWPSLIATGLITLLTGIYQAQARFNWPAFVPLIGALVNLALVVTLVRPFGILGVAFATTSTLILQALLLLPILLGSRRFHFSFRWRHPGIQRVLHMLWPLVFSSFLTRWTPIIDRYLASSLDEGAISHLGYASKILAILTMLLSTGITTVIFSQMALNVAKENFLELRATISLGLRIMWLVTAPVIAMGIALAFPLVAVMFQRGAFHSSDTLAVSTLLQIYLLALVGTLGNITGRTFYVLKDTRTVAFMGVIEALAYALYTPFLVRLLGATGIAWGYVLYFNISLGWHFPVLRSKLGKRGGGMLASSLLQTGAIAGLSGLATWLMVGLVANLWQKLIFGGILGSIVYILVLWVMGVSEVRMIGDAVTRAFKAGFLSHLKSKPNY